MAICIALIGRTTNRTFLYHIEVIMDYDKSGKVRSLWSPTNASQNYWTTAGILANYWQNINLCKNHSCNTFPPPQCLCLVNTYKSIINFSFSANSDFRFFRSYPFSKENQRNTTIVITKKLKKWLMLKQKAKNGTCSSSLKTCIKFWLQCVD